MAVSVLLVSSISWHVTITIYSLFEKKGESAAIIDQIIVIRGMLEDICRGGIDPVAALLVFFLTFFSFSIRNFTHRFIHESPLF